MEFPPTPRNVRRRNYWFLVDNLFPGFFAALFGLVFLVSITEGNTGMACFAFLFLIPCAQILLIQPYRERLTVKYGSAELGSVVGMVFNHGGLGPRRCLISVSCLSGLYEFKITEGKVGDIREGSRVTCLAANGFRVLYECSDHIVY